MQKWCHDKGLIINKKKTKMIHIATPHTRRDDLKILFHGIQCLHNKPQNCKCSDLIEITNTIKIFRINN